MKKRQAYYLNGGEDRTVFSSDDGPTVLEWLDVRHYQCKLLLALLVDRGKLAPSTSDAVERDIECVMDSVLTASRSGRSRCTGATWARRPRGSACSSSTTCAWARENPVNRGWTFPSEEEAAKVSWDTLMSEWRGDGINKDSEEVAKRYLLIEPTSTADRAARAGQHAGLPARQGRPDQEPRAPQGRRDAVRRRCALPAPGDLCHRGGRGGGEAGGGVMYHCVDERAAGR